MYQSIIFKNTSIIIVLLQIMLASMSASAQRIESVHGKSTFSLNENDNMTIKEAKIKCIELAKIEAIKNKFGELILSDFIISDKEVNDEISSIYIMDASSSVKGEWLADEKDPVLEIEYDGENLNFTAEVWGKAREINRAKTDVKWQVLKDVEGKKIDSDQFDSGDRFFIKFKSPADGYVAIYLILSDDETACLLPYRKDNTGRYKIKGRKEYVFFDKTIDPDAQYYKLTTDQLQEMNQLVMIYSPNPFSKCNDKGGDPRHPNTVDKKDFAKWLLKTQRADTEMMVNRTWVTIQKNE